MGLWFILVLFYKIIAHRPTSGERGDGFKSGKKHFERGTKTISTALGGRLIPNRSIIKAFSQCLVKARVGLEGEKA